MEAQDRAISIGVRLLPGTCCDFRSAILWLPNLIGHGQNVASPDHTTMPATIELSDKSSDVGFNHDGIQTIQRLKQVKCAVDQRADRAPPAHAVHAENAFTASGKYSWRYHSSKAARSAVSATTARLPLSTVLRVFPRHLRSRPFQSLLLTVKTRLT